jgi:hypothetical protein
MDTGRLHCGASDLAEVLTVVRRKGMTAETAMRKCAGRKPRTTMMAAAEMRDAMTAAEMATTEMRAAKMPPTKMPSAAEMPAAVTAAKMAATATTVTTTSAASTERGARQCGHENQNGNRNA